MHTPTPFSTESIEKAARLIQAGGLIAFPTETVYGLGADAGNPKAVAKVFEVKNRPTFDPLIVHVSSEKQALSLWTKVPPQASALMKKFWPGPLTLVLPKQALIPDLVTAGLSTVAVRVPDHPMALKLIEQSGVPIAAPSANRFGGISPTTAEAVAQELGGRVDLILDGGPTRVGLESTVVAFEDEAIVVLRPGGVSVEELEQVADVVRITIPTQGLKDSRLSPGMLERHYAPVTSLYVLREEAAQAWTKSVQLPLGKIGLLSYAPIKIPSGIQAVEILSSRGDLTEVAAGFFQALRRLDQAGLDLLVAFPFPQKGLGMALADRLKRASLGQGRLEGGKLMLQSTCHDPENQSIGR